MRVEPFVLGDDERLLNRGRYLIDLDERSPLEPELGDESAVSRVELGRLSRGVVIERIHRGTLSAAAHESP